MAIALNSSDLSEAQDLSKLVRTLNLTGHNPATSGNYSLRSKTKDGYALVSESGIDKSAFHEDNLILVHIESAKQHEIFEGLGKKSSDETALHLAIYKATKANCVLHSHMLEALLFAKLFENQSALKLSGMELLKGLDGIKTHESEVFIPCFENTQDIEALSLEVSQIIKNKAYHAVILRGHGMYVWGDSVKAAKRHLEVFEYLFKYELALRGLKL